MTIGMITSGASQRVIGASCETPTANTASEASANAITCPRRRRPAGSSRPAVRGLRASIAASTRRLTAIANERAPNIATVIQPSAEIPGQPPTARIAPT